MRTEAQKRASAKYDKENTKSVLLKLNVKTDADILAHLETVGSKMGYIKELIRKDIAGVTPTIEKKIVEGDFIENEFVIVSIDGREFKRKVHYSSRWGDLVITVFGNEYAYSEFV